MFLCSFSAVICLSLAMFLLIIDRYQLKNLSKDCKVAPNIGALFLNAQGSTLSLSYPQKIARFVSAKVVLG